MSDLIKTILTSSGGVLILGGIGWLFRDLYHRYQSKKTLKRKDNYLQGLRSIAHVYNSMDLLKETSEITRVLLVEVSNGGNSPRPGSKMYASAINVKHDDELIGREVLQRYEKVQIDDAYINMCIQCRETGGAYKVDTSLKDESLLTSFYRAEGIVYSEVYHIYTDSTEEKMFILSVSTKDEGEKFERDGIRAIIKSEINLIRSEFEKYRDKL